MTELLGHMAAIISMAKALGEVTNDFDKAKYMKQIFDLTTELLQLQSKLSENETELRALKAELEERDKNPIAYDYPVYRDKDGHAFCPVCYDKSKIRIHLSPYNPAGDLFCGNCKQPFYKTDGSPGRATAPPAQNW